MFEYPSHLLQGLHEAFSDLAVTLAHIGRRHETWGLSDWEQVQLDQQGPLCEAHRLDYLPSGITPFHYAI